jgi:hypothetical protein
MLVTLLGRLFRDDMALHCRNHTAWSRHVLQLSCLGGPGLFRLRLER